MTQTYRLGRNERIRLDGGATGIAVRCREGVLWITQTGNPGDRLVRAGDVFSSDRPGRIVIGAIEESTCTVASGRTLAPRLSGVVARALRRFARRFEGVGRLWA